MSIQKRIRCTCPCGYGFETYRNEDNAIAMIQAHFTKYHADMLPFGLTTTEARALLTVIDDTRKARPTKSTYYTTDTTPLTTEKKVHKEKTKKPHILIH